MSTIDVLRRIRVPARTPGELKQASLRRTEWLVTTIWEDVNLIVGQPRRITPQNSPVIAIAIQNSAANLTIGSPTLFVADGNFSAGSVNHGFEVLPGQTITISCDDFDISGNIVYLQPTDFYIFCPAAGAATILVHVATSRV